VSGLLIDQVSGLLLIDQVAQVGPPINRLVINSSLTWSINSSLTWSINSSLTWSINRWTDLCDLGTPGQGAGNQSNYRCIGDDKPAALLWSNIVHATKAARGGERRGFVLTVDGGLGNHRYSPGLLIAHLVY
jgi:hypothetical protein